jgi:hypothetical protein
MAVSACRQSPERSCSPGWTGTSGAAGEYGRLCFDRELRHKLRSLLQEQRSETTCMDATNSSANEGTAQDTNVSLQNDARIVDGPSYDEPYRFGRRPTSRAPFPFTEREFARLLIVRGRLQAADSALSARVEA